MDGLLFSNTLQLHTCYKWSGILIEANPLNFAYLRKNVARTRPERTSIYHGAVCAHPTTSVEFVVPQLDKISPLGGDAQHIEAFTKAWQTREKVFVPCKPMAWYLRSVSHVDFFSLDVEGAELEVLLTIDFSAVVIEVFMVELEERQTHPGSSTWKTRMLLSNLGYMECTRTRVNGSGLFIRRHGPFVGRC